MKKNICRILITITVIGFFGSARAQVRDSIPQKAREFYISFSSFSPLNINLRYKKQVGQKTYLKIGLVSLSATVNTYQNSSFVFPVRNENYSGGVEAGIEFRKALTKKLTFFHGPSLAVVYQYAINRNMDPTFPTNKQKIVTESVRGTIPYTLGLLFHVYTNFYAAVELNPAVYVTYQRTENLNNFYSLNGGFSLDSHSALLSLVYRF